MYSVVLLMALSGGAETPAFGRCGGCNGCYGCAGWCGGCRGGLFGGKACKGCRGCHDCHGYVVCHGCYGCHGYVVCHGCAGYVCHGCAGYVCHGCAGHPHAPPPPPKPMPKKDKEEKPTAAPATIIVNLPADAKLMVDDTPTTSTSSTRVLVSPVLEPGRDFHYTLKGEIIRDGRPVVATQRITVRAGEETRVTLEFPEASVAQR
ncbi:MAG TPA: TIGR03000 domain-containing protein [Gemmataceae bacterium]|nr:TIGR03000 domain-containing protein [Gemmataceae bacterium]